MPFGFSLWKWEKSQLKAEFELLLTGEKYKLEKVHELYSFK